MVFAGVGVFGSRLNNLCPWWSTIDIDVWHLNKCAECKP